jgi:hypothetical protein
MLAHGHTRDLSRFAAARGDRRHLLIREVSHTVEAGKTSPAQQECYSVTKTLSLD